VKKLPSFPRPTVNCDRQTADSSGIHDPGSAKMWTDSNPPARRLRNVCRMVGSGRAP